MSSNDSLQRTSFGAPWAWPGAPDAPHVHHPLRASCFCRALLGHPVPGLGQRRVAPVVSNDGTTRDPAGAHWFWNIAFHNPTGHNAPELSIANKQAVNDGLLFVAVHLGEVIGSIMAGYDGHRGWLYSVAVLPTHRKLGVGSALVAHAEKALIQRGCRKINLQVVAGNEQVIGFYEAIGYVQEPRISMGKLIKA